ncbi:hypothetical protein [Bacillus sp. Marseille-P3661]|uniref:hypothetical protein n=1 Tax=Bacillus sp. Marseille-P3661 TaxID=1936234 RepID=UPI000C83770A|nr:hypothetical protein [Bacillus sp. Marseille-P3661]
MKTTTQVNDVVHCVQKAHDALLHAQSNEDLQHFQIAQQQLQLAQQMITGVDIETISEEQRSNFLHAKELFRHLQETARALQ